MFRQFYQKHDTSRQPKGLQALRAVGSQAVSSEIGLGQGPHERFRNVLRGSPLSLRFAASLNSLGFGSSRRTVSRIPLSVLTLSLANVVAFVHERHRPERLNYQF